MFLSFVSALIVPITYSPEPIRVAVVDSGLDAEYSYILCDNGVTSKDFTDTDLYDYTGHGSNVSGIIWDNVNRKDVCLINLKYYHTDKFGPENTTKTAIEAFKEAVKLKVDVINFSSDGSVPDEDEKKILQTALDNDIIVVVLSGNKEKDLDKDCSVFPACYKFDNKNFHVVGRNDENAIKNRNFGFGSIVTDYAPGFNVTAFGHTLTGTSQATARITADIVSRMVKVRVPRTPDRMKK